MIILITILLVMVPATAILYPLLFKLGEDEFLGAEGSSDAELTRRWESALVGLKNTELESALGNLDDEDYMWLKQQYMNEAVLVLKSMRVEEEERRRFLSDVENEIQDLRVRILGPNTEAKDLTCLK